MAEAMPFSKHRPNCNRTYTSLFSFSWFVEQRAKAIEPALPDRSVLGNPTLQRVEACGLDAASAHPAELLGVDQAHFLQHLQMLCDRGERDAKRLGQRRTPRADRASTGRAWLCEWDRRGHERGGQYRSDELSSRPLTAPGTFAADRAARAILLRSLRAALPFEERCLVGQDQVSPCL